MKIKTLMIIALSFFSIIPVIFYCIFMSNKMSESAQQQYSELIEEMAETGAENLNAYLDSIETIASQISSDKYIIASVSSRDLETINSAREKALSYCNQNTGIKRIVVVNSNGKSIFCTDTNYQHYLTKEDIGYLEMNKASICPVMRDGKTVDYDLVVPVEVKTAHLLVFFDKAKISNMMASSTFPTNGRIVIVDSEGHLLDTNYVGLITNDRLREYYTIKDSVIGRKNLSAQVNFTIDRSDRISYTIPVKDTGWYISTLAESKYAFENSNDASNQLVSSSIILLIVLTAAFITLAVLITEPLKKIQDTLLKINRGDQDVRLEIMGRNEYGEISRNFNELIDGIIVSERRYRTIVELSDNIVFEWSFKTNEIVFSNNFNKKFSYRAPSDHFSDSFLLKCKVHPDDGPRYRADLEKLSKGEEFRGKEYRWKNIYGDYVWMSMSTATIRDSDNNIVKIVGVLNDIDRAKKSESALLARASYDSLTGVYNRETIENIIDDEISKASPDKEGSAILFLDIDDFKIYNDKYSHATGDQVLKFVADTIMKTIKDYGFVGRYGGDEFVICTRNSTTNYPSRVAQQLVTTLKEGFVCDSDDHLSVNVSIGITVIKDNTKHVEEIISMADEAMYRIKKSGKANFGFF